MRVLVTGAYGQLGKEINRQFGNIENIELILTGKEELNVTDIDKAREVVRVFKPDVVINCAAYNAVDNIENEKEKAIRVNTIGAENMAIVSNEVGAIIIYISTDYVFDGKKRSPYIETDLTCPINVYGKSKLNGERVTIKNNPKHIVIRTAWLYGQGNNFVKKMIDLSQSKKIIKVVNDQRGTPTSTKELVKAIIKLIETEKYDVYHATCEGECTWFEFASKIFTFSNIDINIEPCTSKDFIQIAKRPSYSVLENKNLKESFKYAFPDWQDALEDFIKGVNL